MKLIDRLPGFVPRRSRRNPIRGPQQVAECLDVRLNLSALALGADVSSLDEQFDDEYSEWSDLNVDYLGDLEWEDDVANADQLLWDDFVYRDDEIYWEEDLYRDWTYDEETDELFWYTLDTTIVDDLDDDTYFADATYFVDPLADDWFDLYVDDSDSSSTQVSNTGISESAAAESGNAIDGQSPANSAAVTSGVPGAKGSASHFVTGVTHVRSATAHVHAKAGMLDASLERQNADWKIPVASESMPAGLRHQRSDIFSSAESPQDRHNVQRRRARSGVDFNGAASDRTEMIGRLDQLFSEFTHADGVASEFDQIGLSVTYPGQHGSRLLELSSGSDSDTNDNGESARVFGDVSRQSPPERLGSHESVGAVVAAGLVGAAARSGWMLRRRRACDSQAAATGRYSVAR